MDKAQIYSDIIKKLENELKSENEDVAKNFWDKIKLSGSPIIESIKGDDDNAILT